MSLNPSSFTVLHTLEWSRAIWTEPGNAANHREALRVRTRQTDKVYMCECDMSTHVMQHDLCSLMLRSKERTPGNWDISKISAARMASTYYISQAYWYLGSSALLLCFSRRPNYKKKSYHRNLVHALEVSLFLYILRQGYILWRVNSNVLVYVVIDRALKTLHNDRSICTLVIERHPSSLQTWFLQCERECAFLSCSTRDISQPQCIEGNTGLTAYLTK
jgi:hypothetical protein